jgi:hypothetical protein
MSEKIFLLGDEKQKVKKYWRKNETGDSELD